MKQSEHLNPSEESGNRCPVTSKNGRTPPNKHGGVGRQQQQHLDTRMQSISLMLVESQPSTVYLLDFTRMSDHALSIRDCSSLLKTDDC